MRSHGGDRRRETVELFGVENDDGSLAAHRHGLRSLGMGAAHELAEARFCILELPAWRVHRLAPRRPASSARRRT